MLPAAWIAAFFVVSVLVAVAAQLRFPWWFLAPFTLVSMALEWVLRKLFHRPWRRAPQPTERALSNPFALWQGWRIRRRRHKRKAQAQHLLRKNRLPKARQAWAWQAASSRPPTDRWSADGLWDYVLEAMEGHLIFWLIALPVGAMLWFWLIEGHPFWVTAIVTLIFSLLLTLTGVIPLFAALAAFLTSLLLGVAMTPSSRWAYVLPRWQEAVQRMVQREAADAAAPLAAGQNTISSPPVTPVRKSNWLVPLAIGLWIGSTWGDDG